MCDPVVTPYLIAGSIATTAYAVDQQKKATNKAISNANEQAEINRQAEATRATEERAFQEEQARIAREAEATRVEAEKATQAEAARIQREEEAKRVAEERAFRAQSEAARKAFETEQFRAQQEAIAAQRAFEEEMARRQQEAFEVQRAAAEAEAERVRQAEIRRQTNISEGQNTISELFGQFDDNFYGQRAQSYTDYAKPQLDQQYSQAMQSLVRALSRGGNLNSSVRAQSMADLQQQYDRGLISIADQANQYSNQARSAIEGARGNLLSQNATIADPGTIRNLASSQVGTLSASPSFSPLASLISALTRNSGGQSPTGLDGSGQPKKTASIDLFSSAPSVATGTSVN